MLRHPVETTTTAVACRTGAMLVVLLAALGVLAHSLFAGGRQMAATTNVPQLEQGYTP